VSVLFRRMYIPPFILKNMQQSPVIQSSDRKRSQEMFLVSAMRLSRILMTVVSFVLVRKYVPEIFW
jgi:hypothetical protein